LQDIRAYIKNEDYQLPCSVISFANVRHNTGKTLFTLCVAEALNHLGYRVLVIDCDKQGDTSRFYTGTQLPDDTPHGRVYPNPLLSFAADFLPEARSIMNCRSLPKTNYICFLVLTCSCIIMENSYGLTGNKNCKN
jgi:hypothetical protein